METIQLPVRSIVRHCIVKCQLNWRPHSDLQSDAFFLTHQAKKVGPTLKDLELIHPSRFQQCKKCEELENDRTEVLSLFKRHGKQYKTMDICSGAGGLSAGLENGGLFKPKWAIEIDIFSARTYKWILVLFATQGTKYFTEKTTQPLRFSIKMPTSVQWTPYNSISLQKGPLVSQVWILKQVPSTHLGICLKRGL